MDDGSGTGTESTEGSPTAQRKVEADGPKARIGHLL